MKKSEAVLVAEFQSGDKKALAILVKRWHKLFCEKAYWIVKDADLSKDIAQEVWQVIINKIHTLNDVNVFSSWALRIVYTKSFDALRKQSKERLNDNEYEMEQLQTNTIAEDNSSLKDALLKAIQNLPEQQQVVLKLFYTEDYSLKEISDLLNISIGTTKSRLFHAREKLKLILKNKNHEN